MKILLVEPYGGFIRLDRCMQQVGSWGGVFRFPLNLARIGAHLLSLNHEVRAVDLQADARVNLRGILLEFRPDLCILSCGFPSMYHDSTTAGRIKEILPSAHVSTFGVVPTLMKERFLMEWDFPIFFDSVVFGGEPAFGYEELISENLKKEFVYSIPGKFKNIKTEKARSLFNNSIYKSPFTGEIQTYIEGSYGCPHQCTFCVVPQLYNGKFAKRDAGDILNEFQHVIEQNDVQQISLWDEGTTFQRNQVVEICEGLKELRRSPDPKFRSFQWSTRSTTALLDEELVFLMKDAGLSGITLGIESFDEQILSSTNKGTTLEDNERAVRFLKKAGVISIGHIVLGLPEETRESAERTIQGAINSGLDVAQFYCAVPYPSTPLHAQAIKEGLIRVHDLTDYELCNPIIDTRSLSFTEVGDLRKKAMREFYANRGKVSHIKMLSSKWFKSWAGI